VPIGEVVLPDLVDPPVTTTVPPTTTTTSAAPTTTTTISTGVGDRQDRSEREEQRSLRQLENPEVESNEGLLIMTALGLALLLAAVAGLGWVRRRQPSMNEEGSQNSAR
jgi:hypothetical protein